MGCHSSGPASTKDDKNELSRQKQNKVESKSFQNQDHENNFRNDQQEPIEKNDIPLMELKKIKCDMTMIPTTQSNSIRAIVITDTHFGKFKHAEPSIPIIFNELQKVVEVHNSNCVIWLGDTVDIRAKDRDIIAQQFLDTFSDFPVPIYLISGNHDRGLYRRMNVHGSIHYFRHKIMKIESSSSKGEPIYFSHDFGNAFRIAKPDVPSFIWSNKMAQKDLIPSNNWLIIGHVHTLYVNNEKKIASLAPFSIDLQSRCYALIVDGDNGFDISFHRLEPKSNILSNAKKTENVKIDDSSD